MISSLFKEGTTNLLSDSQSCLTDISTFVQPNGGTAAISQTLGTVWGPCNSIKITSDGARADEFSSIGGDTGAMRLGMIAGKTYTLSGKIYVPSATGLTPDSPDGLRIIGYYFNGSYVKTQGTFPTAVDQLIDINCSMTIPAGSTEAFFRLYNGLAAASKDAYYTALQLEQKDHPTSWIIGGSTRPDICNPIYFNKNKIPSLVKLTSDSTAVTRIDKELKNGTPDYNSSVGLTTYRPLIVTVQPGEKIYAYPSSGSPNITVIPVR